MCFVLSNFYLIQRLPMVVSRGIEKIQHTVVYAQHLGERIASKVHNGRCRSCLQIDSDNGIETVVDKKGVELLSSFIRHHLFLPTLVGFRFAIPFFKRMESQGMAFQFVTDGIKDNGLAISIGEKVELVVDAKNGIEDVIEFRVKVQHIGCEFVKSASATHHLYKVVASFLVYNVVQQIHGVGCRCDAVIVLLKAEKGISPGDDHTVGSGDTTETLMRFSGILAEAKLLRPVLTA